MGEPADAANANHARDERHEAEPSAARSSLPSSAVSKTAPLAFGRYVLHAPIARGGMAQVYTARLVGAEGFNRLVAAKRLHPQFTDDPDFVTMFHDEARIASRIHHPNVVPVLDVVVEGTEVILVQEYVHGVPLDRLFKAALASDSPIPIGIVVAIIAGTLSGLHAAHETKDETDQPLNIVHRDVSPQNIMVSVDGIPRLLDFGIARAELCVHVTREGVFKGKVAYMAPEQLRAESVTRAADIYAAGVILWELLRHRRLHGTSNEAQIFARSLSGSLPKVTDVLDGARVTMSPDRRRKLVELSPLVSRSLSSAAEHRFATAAEMLDALLAVCPAATSGEVSAWVKTLGAEYLDRRQKVIAASEESWRSQSKIAAAMPVGASPSPSSSSAMAAAAGNMPESSRVKRAGWSDAPDLGDLGESPVLSSWPARGTARDVRGTTDAPSDRRAVRLPWIVAAALLAFSATLVGVLGIQGPSSPEVPALGHAFDVPVSAVVAEAAAAPPLESPAPSLPVPVATQAVRAPTFQFNPPTPPMPAALSAPVVAHTAWRAPPAKAPSSHPPTTSKDNSSASASPPSPAPSPKADCDPPFYFEGTKKIYKAACL
jgi:serine/threonine protein kinase